MTPTRNARSSGSIWKSECPRAFQTDRSWYQEYWYSQAGSRRPSFARRFVTSQKLGVSIVQVAEILRAGCRMAFARAKGDSRSRGNGGTLKPQMRSRARVGCALPRRQRKAGPSLVWGETCSPTVCRMTSNVGRASLIGYARGLIGQVTLLVCHLCRHSLESRLS